MDTTPVKILELENRLKKKGSPKITKDKGSSWYWPRSELPPSLFGLQTLGGAVGGRVFECLVFSIKRVFKHWGVECLLVFKHWGVECSNTRLIKNTQTLNTRPPAKHFLNQKHSNTKHPKTLKPSLKHKRLPPRHRSDP